MSRESEMRMPLDEIQSARHNFGVLAEHTRLLSDALVEQGIRGPLHDDLLREWWKGTFGQLQVPDFGELLRSILPDPEED